MVTLVADILVEVGDDVRDHAASSSETEEETGSHSVVHVSKPCAPQPPPPPVTQSAFVSQVVMSKDEMNALGAQILRAELMGNDELAEKLRNKLESARDQANKTPAPSESSKKV